MVILAKFWRKRRLTFFVSAVAVAFTTFFEASKALADNDNKAEAEAQKPSKIQSSRLWGPYKAGLLMKPYITIGYHVPELFVHPNQATGDFFSDLTRFSNFKLGLGLRITSYMALEIAYDSIGRQYQQIDAKTQKSFNTILTSHGLYINAVFFSPSIDVKFGTLEFAINVGTMIFVDMQHQVFSPTGFTSTTVSSSLGPQFMAGFSIIYGFPKLFTVRGFTEIITLSDTPFGIPFVLNSGVAINIYLI